MRIQILHDKLRWQDFVDAQSPRTFLQSWQWGLFHESMGGKVFRLGIFEEGELVGAANILKITAKRGNFLFCPHCLIGDREQIKMLLKELKTIAREEHCSFVRISPLLEDTYENRQMFQSLGFRSAPIHMHSELGWILDIRQSREELLGAMRKTTRHCIRNAKRYGVEIEKTRRIADVDVFYTLYKSTVRKKHFVPFSKTYIQKEFEALSGDDMAAWFFAKYKGEVLSAAMIIFTKNSGFYHQGANSRSHPKIPASHLLQWEAICESKRRGCSEYNFWGISPENKPRHPWAGTTRFKKGFGGFQEAYVRAQDLVISPKYWLNWTVETLRRIKRGY